MKSEDDADGCFPSKQAPPSPQEDMFASSQEGTIADYNASQSQPATQPIEELGGWEEEEQEQATVWGQLYPHCGTFPRLPLSSDIFKIGRGKAMDYVIRESDMGSTKLLTAISKCQCEIVKEDQTAFLIDRSSNGTWVNGVKVGKHNKMPLVHNSMICFADESKKVFVFMSSEEVETYPEQLTRKYTVSKWLGRGASGEVRLGFRVPDLYRVAIKIIEKKTTGTSIVSNSNVRGILNEVQILQTVNHPCVIALEDVIDTQDHLYIVLELAEGGELFDKIIEKTKFNEKEAALHFYQIVSAVKYLHEKNICHRDIKPENILLCSEDDHNPVVKITDMGLSKLVDLGTVLRTFCGTPQYLAPEIVKAGMMGNNYSLKVDCWSLGVILYVLLSGTPPFSEDRTCGRDLKGQILTANFKFYPVLWDRVSADAKDLITKLLKVAASERLSAAETLEHPWLQNSGIVEKAERIMAQQAQRKNVRSVSVGLAAVTVNDNNKRAADNSLNGEEKRARHDTAAAVEMVVADAAGGARSDSETPPLPRNNSVNGR